MLILADSKIPAPAKDKLSLYGELLEIQTDGVVYEAISGHPDIFFFRSEDSLIASPFIADKYKQMLSQAGVPVITGSEDPHGRYPFSARYNAAASRDFLIHRSGITENKILELCPDKEYINVRQGYCRCSIIPLRNNEFITSDTGIYKSLSIKSFNITHISSKEVLLPGFQHGFIGGTCGVLEDKIFFCGSLKGSGLYGELSVKLKSLGYEIIELYDGPLFDCGSILFV